MMPLISASSVCIRILGLRAYLRPSLTMYQFLYGEFIEYRPNAQCPSLIMYLLEHMGNAKYIPRYIGKCHHSKFTQESPFFFLDKGHFIKLVS